MLVRRPSEMRPLQVGQIALAHLPDSRYVLHRIVHIDGTEIVLMGDGNLRETESCRLSGIVGVVTKIVRNGRYVDSDARLERRKAEVWGRLLPVRRYLLYLYRWIWKRCQGCVSVKECGGCGTLRRGTAASFYWMFSPERSVSVCPSHSFGSVNI